MASSSAVYQRFSDLDLEPGQRLALRIEYQGSEFSGWQAQPHLTNVVTVQETLQQALSAIAAQPVVVHCAGRTDTGVHACAQWVHFDAPVSRSLKSWVLGANAQLPATVRIGDGLAVPATFHARHSALSRRYHYLIANTRTAPALLARQVLWVREPLDEQRMGEALQALLGERDFSAFRAASCQSTTPMRFMESIGVRRQGEYLAIDLRANAFLHHMVRNIIGSALRVGLGERPVDWLAELLAGRDRTLAGATAPPTGLYLSDVQYPDEFSIPSTPGLPFPAV